jgi:hypothetical protein
MARIYSQPGSQPGTPSGPGAHGQGEGNERERTVGVYDRKSPKGRPWLLVVALIIAAIFLLLFFTRGRAEAHVLGMEINRSGIVSLQVQDGSAIPQSKPHRSLLAA